MDGGEAVQKTRKQADLDSEVENRMKKITYYFYCINSDFTFALLPKISSIVYKQGYSMSASNKLPFSFP